MRRAVVLLALAAAVLAAAAPAADGEITASEWRSQQPLGPEGRTPLGPVGDVECWQANRCLLITAGNGGMPAGLYAYDGSEWHLYSSVCGGHEGRIAWAGPTEFWTISDQQSGQAAKNPNETWRVSLCHFKNGAVVASYAEPLGVAGSYLPMNAAACQGPDECWFGGERLPGTVNIGAFHLYWNGLSLSSVPSLTQVQSELEDPGRAVTGLAFHQGTLYEGVRVDADDEAPNEDPEEPAFLHRVLPGILPAFEAAETAGPLSYGESASPEQLQGFRLSDDGEGLWAASGASGSATLTVLRLRSSAFEQLSLDDPNAAFGVGDELTGLAAVPGGAAAWVAFRRNADGVNAPARLALVDADGTVEGPLELPAEGEGIGRKGAAGPVACAGPGQCWLATQQGWLLHLGPDPAVDAEPAMHVLITARPPDASLPSAPPLELPEDDSGANSNKPAEEALPEVIEEPLPKKVPPLLSKLQQKLIGRRTLELTFVLRVKARVRLVAKRKGKIVAQTPVYVMQKGKRSLRLRLDPKRWPTKLDLQVHEVKKKKKKTAK